MTISVIVPVYNAEKYLSRCLNSILNQTYRDLQIILVDDGSADTSGLLAYAYAQKDKRITVVHKKNGGQHTARNFGITLASGDFITFVDDDDYLDLNTYESMVNVLSEDSTCDIVWCGVVMEKPEEDIRESPDLGAMSMSGIEALKVLINRQPISAISGHAVWNKLYRHSLLEREGLRFDESLHMGDDFEFNARVFAHCHTVQYIPFAYYHYVQHVDNTIYTMELERRASWLTAMSKTVDLVRKCTPEVLPTLYHNFADSIRKILLEGFIAKVINTAEGQEIAFRPDKSEVFRQVWYEAQQCPGFYEYLTQDERLIIKHIRDFYLSSTADNVNGVSELS